MGMGKAASVSKEKKKISIPGYASAELFFFSPPGQESWIKKKNFMMVCRRSKMPSCLKLGVAGWQPPEKVWKDGQRKDLDPNRC